MVTSPLVFVGAEIQIRTLMKACRFKKTSYDCMEGGRFFFHKFILVGCGGNHILQSKIPVEPYYRVVFFPLSRVSSPPILPVLLCYPYSTGLLNCSDEFPSNLFWKK